MATGTAADLPHPAGVRGSDGNARDVVVWRAQEPRQRRNAPSESGGDHRSPHQNSGRHRRRGSPGVRLAWGGPPEIPHDAVTASLVRARGRPSLAAASVGRVSGSEPQPPAPTGGSGSKLRLKVCASPGAEAGDLRRESDRDPRPRPPPGGLGEPRRPETRSRATEQAAAVREPWRPETRSRAAEQAAAARGPWRPETQGRATEQSRHSPCASTRRRDRQSRNRRRRPAPLQWFRSNWTAAGAAGHIKTLFFAALNLRRRRADPRGAALPGLAGRVLARCAPPLR